MFIDPIKRLLNTKVDDSMCKCRRYYRCKYNQTRILNNSFNE